MNRVITLLLIVTLAFGVVAFGQLPNSPSFGGKMLKSAQPLGFPAFPKELSYQGLLTFPSGTPAADGSYDLQFSLFNVAVGGSALWTETQSAVSVQRGTFSVRLGNVTPLSVYFNQILYLQVTALSGPGLSGAVGFSPRTQLAASAFSLGPWQPNGFDVSLLYGRVGIGTSTPKTDLHISNPSASTILKLEGPVNSDGLGGSIRWTETYPTDWGMEALMDGGKNALIFRGLEDDTTFSDNMLVLKPYEGRVGVGTSNPQSLFEVGGSAAVRDSLTLGSPTNTGLLQLYRNGSSNPEAKLYDYSGYGGSLELYTSGGVPTHRLEPDINGGDAGWFQVRNGNFGSAFVVDGNYAGTLEPHVQITGTYRSASFYLDETADASVELPDSSISAREILDEPGVARQGSASTLTVANTGTTNLLSVDIDVPAPGYVIALGSCTGEISGTSIGNILASVEAGPAVFPSGGNRYAFGSTNEAISVSTTRWGVLNAERTFFVNSPGTFTYYFNAARGYTGGSASVFYPRLLLIYVPTSYGTVAAALASAEAAPFMQKLASLSTSAGMNDGGSASETTYNVDLRELELKVAKARAETERLERKLLEAKMEKGNQPDGNNGIRR